MRKILSLTVGIVAILSLFVLNFSHAANSYGMLNNKLHLEVLAQTNTGSSSGSGSGSGSGTGSGSGSTTGGLTNPWFWEKVQTSQECTVFKITSGEIDVLMGATTAYPTGGKLHDMISGKESVSIMFSYTGYIYKCLDGWYNLSCEISCEP